MKDIEVVDMMVKKYFEVGSIEKAFENVVNQLTESQKNRLETGLNLKSNVLK